MSGFLVPEGLPDPLEERLLHALPRLRAHLSTRGPRISGGELDDVAQEVIARALRYRESFDARRALWPWLRRMANHVLTDHHHAELRRPALAPELDAAAPEVERALDAREEVERLLAGLPAEERAVLVLFHREGHSVRVIARDLGLPEGTVKSRLSRARRRLASAEDPRNNS